MAATFKRGSHARNPTTKNQQFNSTNTNYQTRHSGKLGRFWRASGIMPTSEIQTPAIDFTVKQPSTTPPANQLPTF